AGGRSERVKARPRTMRASFLCRFKGGAETVLASIFVLVGAFGSYTALPKGLTPSHAHSRIFQLSKDSRRCCKGCRAAASQACHALCCWMMTDLKDPVSISSPGPAVCICLFRPLATTPQHIKEKPGAISQ
ncbi:unnamed protein product, partial [Phaeothamnion confervicola]